MEPVAAIPDLASESRAVAGALPRTAERPTAPIRDEGFLPWLAQRFIRRGSRWLVRSRIELRVEGCEHVPMAGPVVIASRHFHHQWDAIVLLAVLPRCPHFLAALDWIRSRWHRALLEWACRLLGWPVILRRDGPRMGSGSVYDSSDVPRYMRRAARDALALLASGGCLAVFPEAFPNIDSVPTPKQTDEEFLPFRPGILRLAAWAQKDPHLRVPIVPAGFSYRRGRRWQITVRFGPAIYLDEIEKGTSANTVLEARVRTLSDLPVR